MPAPIKWSAADFELVNSESPEGEPWLAALPDGRFNLTFFESFPTASPAYTDIETRVYSSAGLDTGLGPAPTFSSTTIDHQGAVAYFPDNRSVYVWTEEPAAGGGNLEDVYAAVYVGQLPAVTRFLVAGGAGRQHDPIVAASATGFVVALADDSVASGQLILKFYNAVGGLITTVTDADDPEGVSTPAGSEDDYRDVEITALANGNYVVTWTDNGNFDIWARIYSPTGVAQSGLIEIEAGGASASFPDVTALADGRFLVTHEQFGIHTVRGHIYEANGTPSSAPFTIATDAGNVVNQQVQSAALNDGRFVTVWRNIAGNIEGQVMFADGTPDGAAFAINGDGAGNKGRPTVATLADGRFAVSWESSGVAGATIFTTIFDPREAALDGSASGLSDDWQGTVLADNVYLGQGNDRMSGGLGNDKLRGEDGQDNLNGQDGNDKLYGGNHNDTLAGGLGNDTLEGNLGNDTLNGEAGRDTLSGGDGNDSLIGGTEDDTLNGNRGDDTLSGSTGDDKLNGGDGTDTLNGGTEIDTLNGGEGDDILLGGDGDDRLNGGEGADRLVGGLGVDILSGGALGDTFAFLAPTEGNDRIDDWSAVENDTLEIDASSFGGGLAVGALAANRLVVSATPVADQAFGQFLFDTDTGQLSWDADGTGAGLAVQIARLRNGGVAVNTLSASDFDLV